VDESVRKEFRNYLKGFITEKILPRYSTPVEDSTHIQNIKLIIDTSKLFPNASLVLTGGQINFGVAQKILNLFLKYLWCLGEIDAPPHFPVDRLIQKELNRKIVNWTTMKDETDYLRIIECARGLVIDSQYPSIAEWELDNFNRR
jgi:hypothetical protein